MAFLPTILQTILDFIMNWWWLPLPFILFPTFKALWLWWRRELWASGINYIMLEITMPKEVLKPIKAMEQVMSALWGAIFDPSDNFKEVYIEGKTLLSIHFEIASIGGETHFFLRIPEGLRNTVEAAIYGQYSEVEITLADDYTRYVPQNVPNQDWDLWGCDYNMFKSDVYPLKTYSKFFEVNTESKEEKRTDPMATLLDGLAKLRPGEQIWIQISASPVTNKENNFVTRGRAVVDKLVRRPEKPKSKTIVEEAAEVLVAGTPLAMPQAGPEEKQLIPPEMKLTPGEREIVSAIEEKISKNCFETNIRFVYIAKKDVFFKPNIKIPISFFAQFCTVNLNGFKPWGKTATKIVYLARKSRLYLRKRRMFRYYTKRLTPKWPREGATFVLSTEELATIFHFPGRTVAPAPFVQRVESKKGEAPMDLPIE